MDVQGLTAEPEHLVERAYRGLPADESLPTGHLRAFAVEVASELAARLLTRVRSGRL